MPKGFQGFQKRNLPWNKGVPCSDKTKLKISLKKKGRVSNFKGKHHTAKAKEKNRLSKLGKKHSLEWTNNIRKAVMKRKDFIYYWKGKTGENSANWKGGNCVNNQERNDSAYSQWARQVKRRDNFTCKINNQDCKGKIVAHHILTWKDYPELRYNINNGITLCHAHHPKKRAEEKLLVPILKELISQRN